MSIEIINDQNKLQFDDIMSCEIVHKMYIKLTHHEVEW